MLPISSPSILFHPSSFRTTNRKCKVYTETALAIILNISITAYKLSWKRFQVLSAPILLRTSLKIVQPSIPLLGAVLLIAAISSQSEEAVRQLSRFSIVNTLGLSSLTIVIHECGHFLAARLLLRNSLAGLTIIPFLGGETTYTISYGLTKIGQFVGLDRALLIIAAGGIATSTSIALLEIGFAHRFSAKYPCISELLSLHAISQLTFEILYGMKTLIEQKPNLTNDFIKLWYVGGIHPIIPTAFMTGMLGLAIFHHYKKNRICLN